MDLMRWLVRRVRGTESADRGRFAAERLTVRGSAAAGSALPFAEQLLAEDEEGGHEERRDEGRGEHAADHAGADRVRAAAPAPVAIASGTTPRMNASDVITIGRKRSRPRSIAASARRRPRAAVDAELDDQDRVLRGQPDQRQQPDLEVDVLRVARAARPRAARRAPRAAPRAAPRSAATSARTAPRAPGTRSPGRKQHERRLVAGLDPGTFRRSIEAVAVRAASRRRSPMRLHRRAAADAGAARR